MYRKILQPIMRQHQSTIDRYVELGEKSVRKQMGQLVCPVLLLLLRISRVYVKRQLICTECSYIALMTQSVVFTSSGVCVTSCVVQGIPTARNESAVAMESVSQPVNRFASSGIAPSKDIESDGVGKAS